MPDKRLKGATEYSTHPSTCRSRKRMEAMTSEQREESRARNREYAALRACCQRIARNEDYRRGNISLRKNMLARGVAALMEKRRDAGKAFSGINEQDMINRHLRGEAKARARKRSGEVDPNSLKGVSIDTRDDFLSKENAKSDEQEVDTSIDGAPPNAPTPSAPEEVAPPVAENPSQVPLERSPLPLKWYFNIAESDAPAGLSTRVDNLQNSVADQETRMREAQYRIRELRDDFNYLEGMSRMALHNSRMRFAFHYDHNLNFAASSRLPHGFPVAEETLPSLNIPHHSIHGPAMEPQPTDMRTGLMDFQPSAQYPDFAEAQFDAFQQ